jgi:TetR/AcrR family transcriptional regulator, cholesterol catabolism regulator
VATDRADAIRAEAVRLFSVQGYEATSMRDIAKAVGLLPGSLYAHIRSKEQLLLEIIEDGIDEFVEGAAQAVVEGGSAPDKLRRAVRAHMTVIATGHERTAIVFHQWRSLSGPDRDRVLAKRNAYEQHFVDVLESGVKEGTFRPDLDSRFAVLVILGALNWAPEWFSPSGDRSAQDVAERVSGLLLSGLELPAA